MSEQFKNSYVCPECYCSNGWKIISQNDMRKKWQFLNIKQEYLECQHCQVWVPLMNVLEYNKENKGWFRLD